jgi:hypothetical protein
MATEHLLTHPAEFWSATDTLKKIFSRKLCLASPRGDCEGQIVAGHTIPRNQLQKIAEKGHVYHIRGTSADLLENNGRFTVVKKGIGDFSVLNFFCARHDRELFSPIENDKLIFDRTQLALLHYRAMGAELYKKMSGLDGARHQREQAEKNLRGNDERKQLAESFERGSELGLRDMTRTFSMCESAVLNEEYEKIDGLILNFRKMPTIMTVGGFSPEFDYDAQVVQRLGDVNTTYEQIGLSILAANNKASVVFTWLTDAAICAKFAKSLLNQDFSLLTTLSIQTAFEHLENTCMNMIWWDSLRSIEREKLLARMQMSGSIHEDRLRSCLQFCGINFDDWDYVGFKFAGNN